MILKWKPSKEKRKQTKLGFKLICGLSVLILPQLSNGQVIKVSSSKLNGITLFTNGVEVKRTIEVEVPAKEGIEILISNLPSDLPQFSSSIQAKVLGQGQLLGLTSQSNYEYNPIELPVYKALKDSIKLIAVYTQSITQDLEINKNLEDVLMANKALGDKNNPVNLNNSLDFFEKKLIKLRKDKIELSEKLQSWRELAAKLEARRKQIAENPNNPNAQVTVLLNSPVQQRISIELTYQSQKAYWLPNYQLMVNSASKQAEWKLSASVYQLTGEDWNNQKVKFSSYKSNSLPSDPQIDPIYLDFYVEQDKSLNVRGSRSDETTYYVDGMRMKTLKAESAGIANDIKEVEVSNFESVESLNSFEFATNQTYSIPFSTKERIIQLQSNSSKIDLKYLFIPSRSKSPLILGSVVNWKTYIPISGKGTIFLDSKYSGETYFSVTELKDTLNIGLGNDESCSIEKKQLKLEKGKKTFVDKQFHKVLWSYSFKNNKNFDMQVEIWDQLPISVRKEIEISDINLGGGKHNTSNGQVTWEKLLKPNTSIDFQMGYELTYPTGKRINGLN